MFESLSVRIFVIAIVHIQCSKLLKGLEWANINPTLVQGFHYGNDALLSIDWMLASAGDGGATAFSPHWASVLLICSGHIHHLLLTLQPSLNVKVNVKARFKVGGCK